MRPHFLFLGYPRMTHQMPLLHSGTQRNHKDSSSDVPSNAVLVWHQMHNFFGMVVVVFGPSLIFGADRDRFLCTSQPQRGSTTFPASAFLGPTGTFWAEQAPVSISPTLSARNSPRIGCQQKSSAARAPATSCEV